MSTRLSSDKFIFVDWLESYIPTIVSVLVGGLGYATLHFRWYTLTHESKITELLTAVVSVAAIAVGFLGAISAVLVSIEDKPRNKKVEVRRHVSAFYEVRRVSDMVVAYLCRYFEIIDSVWRLIRRFFVSRSNNFGVDGAFFDERVSVRTSHPFVLSNTYRGG